jgi:hypothetical protein
MGNKWVEHVKKYSKEHNVPFKTALKEAGKSYHHGKHQDVAVSELKEAGTKAKHKKVMKQIKIIKHFEERERYPKLTEKEANEHARQLAIKTLSKGPQSKALKDAIQHIKIMDYDEIKERIPKLTPEQADEHAKKLALKALSEGPQSDAVKRVMERIKNMKL